MGRTRNVTLDVFPGRAKRSFARGRESRWKDECGISTWVPFPHIAAPLRCSPGMTHYFQSPAADCQIASAASAAVSARRMRGPSVTGRNEWQGAQHGAFRWIEAAFRAGEDGGRAGLRRALAPAASHHRLRRRNKCAAPSARPPAISPAPAARAISGTLKRPDCSAASTALAARRSSLTRVTMVRRVNTGCSAPRPVRWLSAPDSRRASSSPARRPATGRAGSVCGAVCFRQTSVDAALGDGGDLRQPFAVAAIEQARRGRPPWPASHAADNAPGPSASGTWAPRPALPST